MRSGNFPPVSTSSASKCDLAPARICNCHTSVTDARKPVQTTKPDGLSIPRNHYETGEFSAADSIGYPDISRSQGGENPLTAATFFPDRWLLTAAAVSLLRSKHMERCQTKPPSPPPPSCCAVTTWPACFSHPAPPLTRCAAVATSLTPSRSDAPASGAGLTLPPGSRATARPVRRGRQHDGRHPCGRRYGQPHGAARA